MQTLEAEAPVTDVVPLSALDALVSELDGDRYSVAKNLFRVMDALRIKLATLEPNHERDFELYQRALVFRAEVTSRRLADESDKKIVDAERAVVFDQLLTAIGERPDGQVFVDALKRAKAHQEEVMRTLHNQQPLGQKT